MVDDEMDARELVRVRAGELPPRGFAEVVTATSAGEALPPF